ncbi:MAG TPA: hypothetical protein VFU27_10680 [Terriglobales bacterium]|nr:hypothetical protein [Terriglobales bacterium]
MKRNNPSFVKALAAVFVITVFAASNTVGWAKPRSSGTEHFIFDDNRIFTPVTFVRPHGTLRKTLAFVDMGTPVLVLSSALAKDLQLDRKGAVAFRIGQLEIHVPASGVETGAGAFRTGADGQATKWVEAVLPGSVMKDYQVIFDYANHRLTLAPPDTFAPIGIAIPCRVNEKTGLISVSGVVGGKTYTFAIDSGSAYSWIRDQIAQEWVRAHPAWKRGIGAVGEANMQMNPGGAEANATLVRVPELSLGDLHLNRIGVLGIAPQAPPFPAVPGNGKVQGDFFDWYSEKAPGPVIGWLGANVLKGFRVMIDYPRHITYWEREKGFDASDLDQVGVTLETPDNAKGYFIAGIARKEGKPTVEGIHIGDKLVEIDGIPLQGRTRGGVLAALHGKPGTSRILTVVRGGTRVTLQARVTSF